MRVGGGTGGSGAGGQAAFAIGGALIMFSPLLLLPAGAIETGSHSAQHDLRHQTRQCGKAGVRSISDEAIVCRDGKVVFR